MHNTFNLYIMSMAFISFSVKGNYYSTYSTYQTITIRSFNSLSKYYNLVLKYQANIFFFTFIVLQQSKCCSRYYILGYIFKDYIAITRTLVYNKPADYICPSQLDHVIHL